jgi:hypothetical protein
MAHENIRIAPFVGDVGPRPRCPLFFDTISLRLTASWKRGTGAWAPIFARYFEAETAGEFVLILLFVVAED